MKTYLTPVKEIERKWYVVDATDKVLGRLATKIASILRGKNKVIFSPHQDVGDEVRTIMSLAVRMKEQTDMKTGVVSDE
jgi:large subunit ribosomal protein L13